MSNVYFVSFSGKCRGEQFTSWDTFALDTPLEYGSDLRGLIDKIAERFQCQGVVLHGWQPIKAGERPAADAPVLPVASGLPLRTREDYPGYQVGFSSEAAALFNDGLVQGAAWQRAVDQGRNSRTARYCPELHGEADRFNRIMLEHDQVIRRAGACLLSYETAGQGISDLAAMIEQGLNPDAVGGYVRLLAVALRRVGLAKPGRPW